MKTRSIASIVKLASDFERLALVVKGQDIAANVKTFYLSFQKFLNSISVSVDQFMNWLNNNATVLGNSSTKYWYVNYDGLLENPLDSANPLSSKVMLISESRELPNSWEDEKYRRSEIIQSAILKGVGNIPNLYLMVVESFSKDTSSSIPKEMLHEEYLFEAFAELFGSYSATPELMISFFQKNKGTIDRIRSLFNGKPKLLGSGSDGVAFALGDQFVLKIFKDKHAYEQAVKAKERLHDHPDIAQTEAMIYDVGVLGEFEGEIVYFYIMEKMKAVSNLDSKSKDIIQEVAVDIAKRINKEKAAVLRPLKKNIQDPTKFKEIKEAVYQISIAMASEIRYSYLNKYIDRIELELKLKANWLYLFVEELIMKYLTSRTDLHLGNLGVTQQGHLRYFDPAFSGWTSNINLK